MVVQVLTSGFLFGTQTSISQTVSSRLAGSFLDANPHGSNAELIDSSYRLQQAMSVSSVACATVSGFLTGGLLSPIVSPLEALKCRAQVATNSRFSPSLPSTFKSIPNFSVNSLSWGYEASVLRCSVGNAAFFGVYAMLTQTDVSPAVGGAVAGAAFWVAGMPFDVLKSRMQTANPSGPRPNLWSTLIDTVAVNGVRGLYTGLPITLLRAVPMNAAVLFVYELVLSS